MKYSLFVALSLLLCSPVYAVLSVSTYGVNILCHGDYTGSANAVASGDTTAGYTYIWSNNDSSISINNLHAGVYTVTVTSLGGATATSSVTITEPSVIRAAVAITGATCLPNSASATAVGTGGTGSYAYYWSNGAIGTTINNLPEGSDTVTITDENNCIAKAWGTVVKPALPEVTVLLQNPTCFGKNNGSINTSVIQGKQPYTYAWSNNATTSSISNLVAGVYNLVVTDANGCQASTTVSLVSPSILNIYASILPVSSSTESNGQIAIITSGGSAPYAARWNNGQNNDTISNLSVGTYTVVVTDSSGCTVAGSYYVNFDLTGIGENENDYVKFYPNPSSDVVNLDIKSLNNYSTRIIIVDIFGKQFYSMYTAFSANTIIKVDKWPLGTYIIEIQSGERYFHKKLVVQH